MFISGISKNLQRNIAQILLVVLIFPLFSLLMSLFFKGDANANALDFLFNLISEIDIFSLMAGLLSQVASGFSAVELTEISLLVVLKAFPEAVLFSLCVHFFVQLFPLTAWADLKVKPLPIFPAFLGIISATIIKSLIELFKNTIITIVAELGVIVIMIIAIRMMFRRKHKVIIYSAPKILLFVIDAIYAVIISIYISSLLVLLTHQFDSIGQAVLFIAPSILLTIVAAVIVWLIKVFTDKDESIV